MIRRSIPAKPLTPGEVAIGKLLRLPLAEEAPRPRTRGDCAGAPRPCPYVACRHHLLTEVNPASGTLSFTHLPRPGEDWPDVIERMPHTCALDVADKGGATMEEVGEVLGLTRERVRQVEDKATEALRRLSPSDGELPELGVLVQRATLRSRTAKHGQARSAARVKLLAFVKAHPGPWTFGELAAACEYGSATGSLLSEFLKRGALRRPRPNFYERGEVDDIETPAELVLIQGGPRGGEE